MSGSADHLQDEKALRLSIAVYVGVLVLKLAAWWWTGVMALLAEGLHTLSDVFIAVFLYVAARWSRREPDAVHMFGYGRAQYVGAIVAATLFVSFTSFELYSEGLQTLFGHEATPPTRDVPVALAVLGASMVAGLWPIVAILRGRARGAAARAQLVELFNDELGLLAAFGGALLLHLGHPLADPLAALVVATIIGVNGVQLFRDTLPYLVGKAPPPEEMAQIDATARGVAGVRGLHRLRAQQLAPGSMHVEMHIEVGRGLPIEDANDIAELVTERIAALTPGPNYVTIHVDPEKL